MTHSFETTSTTVKPTVSLAEASHVSIGARLLKKLLSGMRHGSLTVVLPGGRSLRYDGPEPGVEAKIVLFRWRAVRRLITDGDIGFAEAWIDGDWTSPDLTSVVRLAARNSDDLAQTISGWPVTRLINRLRHHSKANTKRGSQRNIEAHYDLGNEFYSKWLDPSFIYSSAIWTDETTDLEAAQSLKLVRIKQLLAIEPDNSVLEIGCGWGALAAQLAGADGGKVTGLTLSPSQLEWAEAMISSRGLSDRVELRLQDYRDVQGTFDRIVSIEMLEAVGEAYWPSYFATLRQCLKRDGRAVLQVITISEERFENYRAETDFIQKHVFPGGFLPSKTLLRAEIEKAGLRLISAEYFGHSYARTLAVWRSRFLAHWPEIEVLGFDEEFRRLWDYYLSYCEAGFLENAIDVGLYVIEHKPQNGSPAAPDRDCIGGRK